MARQIAIPCIVMRGGTSKGVYFRTEDLPADPVGRDRFLLAAMGSPDIRQIDGIGGADTLTSKVAMVGRSRRAGVDVDYLFAQIAVDKPIVDTGPSCGNILAGVGPFAIEAGLVEPRGAQTSVVIHNLNTDSRIEAIVPTPEGFVDYDGDTSMHGVPGTAAAIRLNFMDIVGSKTGALLPTGRLREEIEGLSVTLIDVAVPMMILRAADLGKTGYETPAELDADRDFFARLERMRREAGRRMGLGDVADRVVPKAAIIAPPRGDGAICARYFVPQETHVAFAVTGGLCVAACAVLAGSVSDGIALRPQGEDLILAIEHPVGILDVALATRGEGPGLKIRSGGVIRTARKLMAGEVYAPARVSG